jgi:hypothetical protein
MLTMQYGLKLQARRKVRKSYSQTAFGCVASSRRATWWCELRSMLCAPVPPVHKARLGKIFRVPVSVRGH